MIKLLFALIAITGYIANIKDKKSLSYWLWLFSNTGWFVMSLFSDEWALALMFLVYDGFCIYGLYKENNNGKT